MIKPLQVPGGPKVKFIDISNTQKHTVKATQNKSVLAFYNLFYGIKSKSEMFGSI